MLLSKIVLEKPKEMDRHKFYRNIRDGAKEAKRANINTESRMTTEEDTRPKSFVTSATRKTTRFDDEQYSIPRYNSEESMKISVGQISRQPSVKSSRQPSLRERSFRETIYSPRTERRRPNEDLNSPPRAESGFLGGSSDNETRKSARRERSREKEDIPVLAAEDSKSRLTTENRLLRIEMDDVNSQLEVLKNSQESALHRLNEVRREMDKAGREHLVEIENLKEKVRELESDGTDLRNELDSLRKKKELQRVENERLRSELERLKDDAEHDKNLAKSADRLKSENLKLEEELERKSKMLDNLIAENNLFKEQEQSLTKERDLEDKLGKITDKLDRKRHKLVAARKDIENLQKVVISAEQVAELRAKIEKLGSELKGRDMLLEEAKREHRDAEHEKNELDRKCKDLKDQFIELHAQLNKVQKTNDELNANSKESESENTRLRKENEELKDHLKEEKENALKLLRFSALEEKVTPLKETIREQDTRIADLDKEVDTLRHAVHGYQNQIDAMRIEPNTPSSPHPTMPPQPLPDHAAAHRRLLEENARLLTLVDQYRQFAHVPPPAVDHSRSRSNGELEDTKRQLTVSKDRVTQLEKWLDEIYNDKNFQVILKGQGKGQKVATLPDLPKKYILAKGSNDLGRKLKPGAFTDRPRRTPQT